MSDPLVSLQRVLGEEVGLVFNHRFSPYHLGVKVSQMTEYPYAISNATPYQRVIIMPKHDGWSFTLKLSLTKDGKRQIQAFERNGNPSKKAESLIPHSAFTLLAYQLNAVFHVEGVALFERNGEWKPLTYKGVSMAMTFCNWWDSHMGKREGNKLKICFYAYRLFSISDTNAGMIEGAEFTTLKIMNVLITANHGVVFPVSHEIAQIWPLDKEEKGVRFQGELYTQEAFRLFLLEKAKRDGIEGFVCTFPDGDMAKYKPQRKDWNDIPRLEYSMKIKSYFSLLLAVFKTENEEGDIRYLLAGIIKHSTLKICGCLDYRTCHTRVKDQLREMPRCRIKGEPDFHDSGVAVEIQCVAINETFQLEGIKSAKDFKYCHKKDLSNIELEALQNKYWKIAYETIHEAKNFVERTGYHVGGSNPVGKRSRRSIYGSDDEDTTQEPPTSIQKIEEKTKPILVEPEKLVVYILPYGMGPMALTCRRNQVKSMNGNISVTPSDCVTVVVAEESTPHDVIKKILINCNPLAVPVTTKWLVDSSRDEPKTLKPLRGYAIELD